MIKSSSPASGNKDGKHSKGSEGSAPAALLRRLGDRMFAADDRRALEHGWQISVRHGGLSRCYRDPRFGWLPACPQGGEANAQPLAQAQ